MGGEEVVQKLYEDYENNYKYLFDSGEISIATDYKNQFSKIILLSAASFFEERILDLIKMELNPSGCELTNEFIKNKGLARQYHTLFDWDSENANRFFSLFGDKFKEFMKKKIDSDISIKLAINDFIKLGGLRNKLVHQNYAVFVLDMTVEEIYSKYSNATKYFIDRISGFIHEFRGNHNQ